MTFDIELLNQMDLELEKIQNTDADIKNEIIPQFKMTNYVQKY